MCGCFGATSGFGAVGAGRDGMIGDLGGSAGWADGGLIDLAGSGDSGGDAGMAGSLVLSITMASAMA